MSVTSRRPRATVAIPMYDNEPYISAAIESVLRQTEPDLELVIYDDASRDRSLEIARAYRDPRVRVLAHPANVGVEANWNACLRAATGTYVKLLCGDDFLAPDCLAKQIAAFEAPGHAGVAVVSCARSIVDERGEELRRRGFARSAALLGEEDVLRLLLRHATNFLGEPGSILFRRADLERVRGYRMTYPYVIDLDFTLELARRGQVLILPDFLAAFRLSPTSCSARIGLDHSRQFMALLEELRARGRLRASRLAMARTRARATLLAAARVAAFRYLTR
jgi:glycosyltransferase involved in cell wall biosynthesis